MRKRAFHAVLLLFALLAPFLAYTSSFSQDLTAVKGKLQWEPLWIRSTTAASTVVREQNWAKGGHGQPVTGFGDSVVIRRAGALTAYDTSAAYRTELFAFPSNLGPSLSNALVDTSSVPWLFIRLRQDSISFGTPTLTHGLDSIRVAAETSQDGINWFSCPGTNTRRFDTVFLTSGQDGLQNPTLIGVEASPGEDAAFVTLSCHPSQAVTNSFILNRTLCMAGAYVRFIFGGDYNGQFVAEMGRWQN